MITDIKIRAARGREKPYKLTIGEGLFLLVTPNHSRLWRFRYGFGGKENLISFGAYDPGGVAAGVVSSTWTPLRVIEQTVSNRASN